MVITHVLTYFKLLRKPSELFEYTHSIMSIQRHECMSVEFHSGENICICIYTNNATIIFTSGRAPSSFETVFVISECRLMVFGVFELGRLKEQVSKNEYS